MVAQIGWIDFSEKDRKKALDVIHLLQEPGAVDELGLGRVRDAFSNYFFPGTSTVQTRAKYFFIVPYVMMEACANPKNGSIADIVGAVDRKEYECARKMGDNDGVIGRDVLPGWVVRKPSNIYWNGLKKLGIFTYPNYSITDYYREELKRRERRKPDMGNRGGEENERDDETATASGARGFWNSPREYEDNYDWFDNLKVELQPWEAEHLRECIGKNVAGSLFAIIVRNNIQIVDFLKAGNPEDDHFRVLSERVDRYVDDNKTKQMMVLANQFNSLVFLCRILYNRILFDGSNEIAEKLWNSQFEKRLNDVRNLGIDSLLSKLNLGHDERLRSFLEEMKQYFVDGNIEAAKQSIVEREVRVKDKRRAKLLRRSDYANLQWVGGFLLDYRLGAAARIIKDIYNAENK